MNKLNFLACILIATLSSCSSAMEWQYKHPGLKEDTPYVLINEEELQANNITSTIKGFVANPSSPDLNEIIVPVGKDSSGIATAKLIYALSPWGLVTAPFADFTGKTIAVPPGHIGIVIHRSYYKAVSKEPVVRKGDSCSYEAKAANWEDLKWTFYNDRSEILDIVYENYEWDDIMVAELKPGLTYTLNLSRNTLVDPDNGNVAVLNNGLVSLPMNIKLDQNRKVVLTQEPYDISGEIILGSELTIEHRDKEKCTFTIKGNDKMTRWYCNFRTEH